MVIEAGPEQVWEAIRDVGSVHRRLAYAVIEGSRLPITHHHATMQVFPEGPDHSRLLWITDVLPHEVAGDVRARVERGALDMKQTLEHALGQGVMPGV